MNDYDTKEMLRAAIRRARFQRPKSIDEFIRYLIQEMELELAEAWGKQHGYC